MLQTVKNPGPEGVVLAGGDGTRGRFKSARYGLLEGVGEEAAPKEKAPALPIDTVKDNHFTRWSS